MAIGHYVKYDGITTTYISLINLVKSNQFVEPKDINTVTEADSPNCYPVDYLGFYDKLSRYCLMFGGPIAPDY